MKPFWCREGSLKKFKGSVKLLEYSKEYRKKEFKKPSVRKVEAANKKKSQRQGRSKKKYKI